MGGRPSRSESPHQAEARLLGQALRAAREASNIAREELASLAGVSVSTVQKIEVGPIVDPGYFTMRALAEALGLTLLDLDPNAGPNLSTNLSHDVS